MIRRGLVVFWSLILATSFGSAVVAEECEGDDKVIGTAFTYVLQIPVASTSVLFLAADVVYAVDGEWLSPGLATGQLLLAGFPNLLVGSWALSSDRLRCSRLSFSMAIVNVALGAFLTAHGITNALLYEPGADAPESEGRGSYSSLSFGLGPVEGGAVFSLQGRF